MNPASELKQQLRQQLRQNIRTKRQQLSPEQLQQHAQQLSQQLIKINAYTKAKKIAAYLANDNEISLDYFMKQLTGEHKDLYLPILDPTKKNFLKFMPYYQDSLLVKNCYGIEEPEYDKELCIIAEQIDIILMPLVAFDRIGNRLGMGGGYYDRSLAFIKDKPPNQPILVGIAHSLQEVSQLQNEDWDIKVNYIATEKELIKIT